MATNFIIHEDEKENRTQIKTNPIQNGKDKRQMTALLENNNQINVRETNGNVIQKALNRDQKIKLTGKINNENDYPKHVLTKNNIEPKVPVTAFKAFNVYQDKSVDENKKPEEKDLEISVVEVTTTVCANVSSTLTSAIRDPLREIKPHDFLETPMSVSGMLSPMSVDKSMLEENRAILLSPCPRNYRERFFDIEEYQLDILDYLREAETRNRPKHGYMKKQPDITHSMRTILVDWLVEVCEEYRLQSETLCLAISYIDRFLSFMSVVRAKLQLVGTAAMYIAAKYEEIYPPDISEFVFITDDTYTKKQVLRMEQLMLKVLSFDLSIPSTQVFIHLYSVLNNIPEKVKILAMYFCELSLLQADPYLQYLPSRISASALALSRHVLNEQIWTKELENTIGYNLDDLQEIIIHLNHSHKASGNCEQRAIPDKYKTNKYLYVSQILPCHLDEDVFCNVELNTTNGGENNEDVRKMISSLIFN